MRNMTSAAFAALASSYPHQNTLRVRDNNRLVDTRYPGTAVERLIHVTDRVRSIPDTGAGSLVDRPWREIRERLLWAGGLRVDRSTSHAFNDDNHCDLTTMLADPAVVDNRNADGAVSAISRNNFLGDHIRRASVAVDAGGGAEADGAPPGMGSWSTCTNGAHEDPPRDVAHVQFASRVAFKLVWCPRADPPHSAFLLVDDEGRVLKAGRPVAGDADAPHLGYRRRNYDLVAGGKYAAAADSWDFGGGLPRTDGQATPSPHAEEL
jgi:hypothetical protein